MMTDHYNILVSLVMDNDLLYLFFLIFLFTVTWKPCNFFKSHSLNMDGKTICMNYTLSTFAKHTTTKLCCDSKHTTEHVLLLVVEGTIKKNVFSILDSSLSSMALIYPSICLLSSLSITSLSIVQGMEVVSVMVKGLREQGHGEG